MGERERESKLYTRLPAGEESEAVLWLVGFVFEPVRGVLREMGGKQEGGLEI